jgi:hypothetical protein
MAPGFAAPGAAGRRFGVNLCGRAFLALTFTLGSWPAMAVDDRSDAVSKAHAIRDSAGHLVGWRSVEPDGSRRSISTDYWPKTEVARGIVTERRDTAGRLLEQTAERFDPKGRLRERRNVSVDAEGRTKETRTLVHYDANGRALETTSLSER